MCVSARVRAGVCGDPFQGGDMGYATMPWGRFGVAGTYSPGQRITMRITLTANHGGRFAFQLCDRTSNLDHACFNRFLTRADIPGERYWWLFTSTLGDFTMVSRTRGTRAVTETHLEVGLH